MEVFEILIIISLAFNSVTGAVYLYWQWQTKEIMYWALFFASLALFVADALLLLLNVNVFFVGPASGLIYAMVVLRLYFYWLKATRMVHSSICFTVGRVLGYFLCLLYPVCAILWFVEAIDPFVARLGGQSVLYLVGACMYGGGQLSQVGMGLWLLQGVWREKREADAISTSNMQLKRMQLLRLIAFSILLIPPNLSNFQQPYISPIIWLIWACIAMWPGALVGMQTPLRVGVPMQPNYTSPAMADVHGMPDAGSDYQASSSAHPWSTDDSVDPNSRDHGSTAPVTDKRHTTDYGTRSLSNYTAGAATTSLHKAQCTATLNGGCNAFVAVGSGSGHVVYGKAVVCDEEHAQCMYTCGRRNYSTAALSHASSHRQTSSSGRVDAPVRKEFGASPKMGARQRRRLSLGHIALLLPRRDSSPETSDEEIERPAPVYPRLGRRSTHVSCESFSSTSSAAATAVAVDIVTRTVVEAQDRSRRAGSLRTMPSSITIGSSVAGSSESGTVVSNDAADAGHRSTVKTGPFAHTVPRHRSHASSLSQSGPRHAQLPPPPPPNAYENRHRRRRSSSSSSSRSRSKVAWQMMRESAQQPMPADSARRIVIAPTSP
ncbi:hypothetical protein THASP1DRAFT_29448 [Thamnocephalis sphaerospora]|uniref:Uncharacterized protein n=1 Tax=Thamnocephalis sphaerospora TaxID=78915 RepID=A0A4P9XT98_9FUNG|nr:hypothetical protein THASP1DRAFT_29448 [Thamnocephalis sphaerospora]|eukprot:RKP08761.1 hypothetical protein THASP1DRAFT_29448 [Thamnocephalis sphaerospora]